MLVLNLGEPPTKFTWTRKDAKGNPVETKEYTPQSFFQEYIGDDLKNNYVMLMNDPSRDYYKLYEIDYDRHAYDGKNWTYVNLPIEDTNKWLSLPQGQYHDVFLLRRGQVLRS